MSDFKFSNGAFIGITGNLPQDNPGDPLISHHLTITGDPAGGIMKCHDTFSVGSMKTNVSGEHYNGMNSFSNDFNPSPEAAAAFGTLFKK